MSLQRVMLEVRPRPGDTLHVLLDHTATVTIPGVAKLGSDQPTTYSTSYQVSTRDVVERADAFGTIVHAIVDSVRMRTSGSIGASPFPGVDRGMEGMKVRLYVRRDGGSRVVEGLEQLDVELREIFGAMPAVLPLSPVGVRESWTRDLPLPSLSATAAPGGEATVLVRFSLDSLTNNGDLAWISFRGRVVPRPVATAGKRDGDGEMSGSLAGELRLDRRRGWLAESSATVSVESTVALPGVAAPMRVRVRLDQRMRTAPARR